MLLGVVVFGLLLGGRLLGSYIDGRAEDARVELLARLDEAKGRLDYSQVAEEWAEFSVDPSGFEGEPISGLPTEDRIAIRQAGQQIIAVYKVGYSFQQDCYDLVMSPASTEIVHRDC